MHPILPKTIKKASAKEPPSTVTEEGGSGGLESGGG